MRIDIRNTFVWFWYLTLGTFVIKIIIIKKKIYYVTLLCNWNENDSMGYKTRRYTHNRKYENVSPESKYSWGKTGINK